MIENEIFYNIRHLTLSEKEMILNEAYTLRERWWVDILDCNISFARQKVEMSYNDIMLKFQEKSHFVVIHRKCFENYGEIGFCTLKSPEYFLWINLAEEKLQYIVSKFDLKPMI
jgi:hypothetical protein